MVGTTEPLSRADASNLQLESAEQVNVVLAAGTLSAGGFVNLDGTVELTAVRAAIASRLADEEFRLRRLSQRITGGADPHWEPVALSLTHHVRVVDQPPGLPGLAALCGRLMTVPLPPDRPLWELLIIPGTPQQPACFVLRLHHCVADGTGGVRLLQQLLEPTPNPPPTSPAASGVGRRPRLGLSVARIAALLTARIGPTPLLGRISQQRAVAFAQTDLAAISRGSRRHGGTINDALLAAVAVGVGAAVAARGEPVPTSVRASVPVALPDRGGSGNATGVMVVDLPTAEADLARCVAVIAAQTAAAKQEARSQGTFELTRSRWSTRLFWFLARHQRFVALFVSNVKGPTSQLVLAGAPVAGVWPVTPIQGNVRVGVTALSYHGRLYCGVHADLAGVDATVLTKALQRSLDALALD